MIDINTTIPYKRNILGTRESKVSSYLVAQLELNLTKTSLTTRQKEDTK